MKIIPQKSNSQEINIQLAGEIVLGELESFMDDFVAVTNQKKKIIINTKEIENIDLAGIQFLYSLKKTFSDIDININLSENAKKLVEIAGLDKYIE